MNNEINEIVIRLKKVIDDSGMSYMELQKATNIAKSSLQRYASGNTKKIPTEAIIAIANATKSSAAWIMGWEKNTTPTSNDIEIVNEFEKLTDEQKTQVKNFIIFLSEERK